MKIIPSREEILRLLDRLNKEPADALESDVLEFRSWQVDVKNNLAEAIELAVCFANDNGGVIVFGVKDKVIGRNAITGCKGYDLDVWRRGIYQDVRPNLAVDIEELQVPEGILLLVRVPKGPANVAYGTSKGIYKIRVGKNCMPFSPDEFQRRQVAEGIIDWSAEIAEGISYKDLSPIEIARLKNTLKAHKPSSDLLGLSDRDLLEALGIVRKSKVTRAGVLFLCDDESILKERFPQHEVIYLYQTKETEIEKRANLKLPLLAILERLTDLIGSRNPIKTIKIGLFHINIPSYPETTFREVILNALCHRNYLEEGSIYVRHTPRQMTVSNPGGFISDITPENILVHEPKQRNRHLAEILEKIGLVERAGIGRRRIFIPMLSFGKQVPYYEADEHMVKLTLNNGSFDERMATFIAKKQKEGFDFSLDHLLLFSYMKEHNEIDVGTFSKICQRPEVAARDILEQASLPPHNLLERGGKKKGVTYCLSKGIANELIGKVAYSKTKGIDKIRYAEMIRSFVEQHGSIGNKECRQLLGLGGSRSAKVTATNILQKCDFLEPFGSSKKATKYRLGEKKPEDVE